METPATGRLHALDNLRALMMWLGIVLHVGAVHTVQATILPWRDPQSTLFADFAVGFIHSFRMPVFFIVAGFFAMLLLQSRGPRKMAEHRLLRIGGPFAVFVLPVTLLTGVFAALYIHRASRGTWGVDISLVTPPPGAPPGPNLLHLWFLWLLLWFCLAAATLAQFEGLRPAFAAAGRFLQRVGGAWWGVLVLALPLMGAGWGYPRGLLTPTGMFLPPAAEWLHNGAFFVFGLALYAHRDKLFAGYARHWWRYALAGWLPFIAAGSLMQRNGQPADIAFLYGCASWLWSFAALGIGLRFMADHSRTLGYLSNTAYWVYLVHLPVTVVFGLLLYASPWPALLKWTLNVAATTIVCLASYELWVRSTWVGELLSGKRLPPRAAPGVPQAPAT
jgi:glucan biosynthesis protein C